MIPIRDSIPPHRFPLINYVIIGLCSLAFLIQLKAGGDGALEGEDERIVEQYGMVPLRITQPGEVPTITMQEAVRSGTQIIVREREREIAPAAISPWLTLITCMFLHGGLMHFLGNMWFLHIFGDNVEDRFGHFGYVLLYLGTGIAAGLAHLITNPNSFGADDRGQRRDRGCDGSLLGAVPALACSSLYAADLSVRRTSTDIFGHLVCDADHERIVVDVAGHGRCLVGSHRRFRRRRRDGTSHSHHQPREPRGA